MNLFAKNVSHAAACAAHANRWITSSNPADYQAAVQACSVFSDVVGNTISIDNQDPLAFFYLFLLNDIVMEVLSQGFVISTNPADYTTTANAIATLFETSKSGFINPP